MAARRLSIVRLLWPHARLRAIAAGAMLVRGATELLEPWPLKVIALNSGFSSPMWTSMTWQPVRPQAESFIPLKKKASISVPAGSDAAEISPLVRNCRRHGGFDRCPFRASAARRLARRLPLKDA